MCAHVQVHTYPAITAHVGLRPHPLLSHLWAQQQFSHLLILTGGKATDLRVLSEL